MALLHKAQGDGGEVCHWHCSAAGAIDDGRFCSKHKVLELRSVIGTVRPRGAIDDWRSCSKHRVLELMPEPPHWQVRAPLLAGPSPPSWQV